jgi:hypothetical protein
MPLLRTDFGEICLTNKEKFTKQMVTATKP